MTHWSTSCQEREMLVAGCLKNLFEFDVLKISLNWHGLFPAYPQGGQSSVSRAEDRRKEEKSGVSAGRKGY